MFVNRATLIGFLGKDADVRYTRNETSFTVLSLSLATKRIRKNRETREYESKTTWHRCIVWGAGGEFSATLTKGAHLQIKGEIRSREYTKGDEKRTITETAFWKFRSCIRSRVGARFVPRAKHISREPMPRPGAPHRRHATSPRTRRQRAGY